MFGCETAAAKYTGGVRFIADDYALECEVGGHLRGPGMVLLLLLLLGLVYMLL
jgi:hypothetical protein